VNRDCCPSDKLCDAHVDAMFAHLRGVAANRGAHWANELQLARRQPWTPWTVDSERVRAMAVTRIADITRDPRLQVKLVDELVRWAAKRWDELGG
jgi:hypothetical protein